MSELTNAADATATAAEVKTEVVAADPKPAEAAPAVEAKDKVEEAAAKPAVPEKYELKLAEGSKLSAKAMEEVSALAKAKGYTNDQAQELLDQRHTAVSSFHEQQQQELATLNDTTWKQELLADKEFGGAKFDENMILAHSAAEKWFGKEFADSLKAAKLNHNPRLIKGLYRIAQAGANDTHVQSGNQDSRGKIPLERQMYPNMFNKES
jgi:hypothetical protein